MKNWFALATEVATARTPEETEAYARNACIRLGIDPDAEAGRVTIYTEVAAERVRAHEKHKNNPGGSIEDRDPEHWRWFTILGEEKGEVDKAANDYEHGLYTHDEYLAELRKELIQVAAVACAWADKLGELT